MDYSVLVVNSSFTYTSAMEALLWTWAIKHLEVWNIEEWFAFACPEVLQTMAEVDQVDPNKLCSGPTVNSCYRMPLPYLDIISG